MSMTTRELEDFADFTIMAMGHMRRDANGFYIKGRPKSEVEDESLWVDEIRGQYACEVVVKAWEWEQRAKEKLGDLNAVPDKGWFDERNN